MIYKNGKVQAFIMGGKVSEIKSITILRPPDKTVYYDGDVFDPTGMLVCANFLNDVALYIDHAYLSFNPYAILKENDIDVSVSFTWNDVVFTVKQPINVILRVFAWWSPEMTSNTTPSPFVVSTSSLHPSVGYAPWYAFDGKSPNTVENDAWASAANPPSDTWLKIDFGEEKYISGARLKNRTYSAGIAQFPKTVYIDVSNDGQTWETLYTETDIPRQTVGGIWVISVEFDEAVSSRYVRFSNLGLGGVYASVVAIADIEFLVPTIANESVSTDDLTSTIQSDTKADQVTSTTAATAEFLPTTATSSSIIYETQDL